MNDAGEDQSDALQSSLIAPYPGLRPYRPEERHLFFGRERDAALLTNQILAARLTLFFGQSGRGKSSLLQTLLIPRLEAEDSRVFAYDSWAPDDPIAALAEALSGLIDSSAAAGLEEPSVADDLRTETQHRPRRPQSDLVLPGVVRRLTAYDPRPLVIILDQFEEFFVHHNARVQPMRQELAALVRIASTEDLRIVISLREEFLASLEILRRDIPGLFDSTFRLEPLTGPAVREAIAEPARIFGVTVEPQFVERLIRDIEGGIALTEQERAPVSGADVELPTLQMVLREVWEAASGDGLRQLDLALYEKLGGVTRVLADYVEKVMPRSRRDRWLTARLLQHLAPPSGLKAAYSIEDLATVEKLPRARVAAELERLGAAAIVRAKTFRQVRLFELQHDAFISVLSPWRDKVLQRARQRRIYLIGAGAAAVVLLIVVGSFLGRQFYEDRETRQITQTRLEELRAMRAAHDPNFEAEARQRIDAAVRYVLFKLTGPGRLDRLARMLQTFEDVIPFDQYIKKPKGMAVPPSLTNRPLFTLTMSSRRQFDETSDLQASWQDMTLEFMRLWGIPVSGALKIERDDALRPTRMRLQGPSGDSLGVEADDIDEMGVINRLNFKDKGPVVAEFFEHFKTSLIEIPKINTYEGGVAVPRWTFPVWMAVYGPVEPATEITAISVLTGLLSHPIVSLTPDAVDVLLNRLAAKFPQTVAEAKAIRGTRLTQDLIAIVKNGTPLLNLPVILDALSSRSTETSDQVAADFYKDENEMFFSASGGVIGPGSIKADQPITRSETQEALDQAAAFVPEPDPPIRIIVGDNLFQRLDDPAKWNAALEQISIWRDRFMRRYGIVLPSVRFRESDDRWTAGSNEFRIAILDQAAGHADATPIAFADGADAVMLVLDNLDAKIVPSRFLFITPESVQQTLDGLSPDFRGWFSRYYRVSDLKFIFREIAASKEPTYEEGPERTLRHSEWLLPALVFLRPLMDDSITDTARALLELQRLKLEALTGVATSASPTPGRLRAGIEALAQGKIKDADDLFGGAEERRANRTAFIRAYANGFREWRDIRTRKACQARSVTLSLGQRLDVEDIFAAQAKSGPSTIGREFGVCLQREYRRLERQYPRLQWATAAETQLRALLGAAGDIETWEPSQAIALGRDLLKAYVRREQDAERLDLIRKLLVAAIRKSEPDAAVGYISDVNSACPSSISARCTELLDELTAARLPDLALERAGQVVGDRSQPSASGRKALGLLAQAQVALRQKKDATSPRTKDYVSYVEACGEDLVGTEATPDAWNKIEEDTLTRIAQFAETDLREGVKDCLIDSLFERRQYAHGRELSEQWHVGPDSIKSESDTLLAAFGMRDRAAAESVTDKLLAPLSSNADISFEAAIGAIVTQRGDWQYTASRFVKQDHVYRRLVMIILSAFSAGDDQVDKIAPLKKEWEQIQPNSWEARLRDGDRQAWYEMLLGIYLGQKEIDEARILVDLGTPEAFKSSTFINLNFTRQGMLCEFEFYRSLRSRAAGKLDDWRAGLRRTTATEKGNYWEYAMADFLLSEPTR